MLIAVDRMDSGTRICMVHESGRLCELGRTATDCAKTYEPIVSRFGRQTRVGPKTTYCVRVAPPGEYDRMFPVRQRCGIMSALSLLRRFST